MVLKIRFLICKSNGGRFEKNYCVIVLEKSFNAAVHHLLAAPAGQDGIYSGDSELHSVVLM